MWPKYLRLAPQRHSFSPDSRCRFQSQPGSACWARPQTDLPMLEPSGSQLLFPEHALRCLAKHCREGRSPEFAKHCALTRAGLGKFLQSHLEREH